MILDYNEFKTWLESKSPKDIVGHAGSAGDCPVTQYLKHAGHKNASVEPLSYCLDEQNQISSPEWVWWFVCGIDRLDDMIPEITADYALYILGKISHWELK